MMTKATICQQTTTHDLDAWMDDFMTRLELRVISDHRVIHQDGTVEEVQFKTAGAGE